MMFVAERHRLINRNVLVCGVGRTGDLVGKAGGQHRDYTKGGQQHCCNHVGAWAKNLHASSLHQRCATTGARRWISPLQRGINVVLNTKLSVRFHFSLFVRFPTNRSLGCICAKHFLFFAEMAGRRLTFFVTRLRRRPWGTRLDMSAQAAVAFQKLLIVSRIYRSTPPTWAETGPADSPLGQYPMARR